MDSEQHTFVLLVEIFLLMLLVFVYIQNRFLASPGPQIPLPPGQKRLPLIGNLLDMPKSRPWIKLRDLSKHYGDATFFKMVNQPLVVLNTANAISDVLEKHSVSTSDRKQTPSISMAGLDWAFSFMSYGSTWRFYRRIFSQHFHPDSIVQYRYAQQVATRKFLAKLLANPASFLDHIQYAVSAAILDITYGLDADNENEDILAAIDEGLAGARRIIVSGGFLVDIFPFIRHYPAWLPGGGFKRRFNEMRRACMRLRDMPFNRYNEAITSKMHDEGPHCIVSDILSTEADKWENSSLDASKEEVARNIAAVTFFAASDVTVATLQVLFLAMSLHPEAQKKAQAEIDAVVGHARLPTIGDRESLVYVNALFKECMRWLPIQPFGMSHATTKDVHLQDNLVPAGSIVMANVWACMQDPKAYNEPETFQPERFIREGQLNSDVRDPESFVFGFGRRICPGRFFAQELLFVNIASVLQNFEITPPVDEEGNIVRIEPIMSDSVASRPEDCRCTIKPRGPWVGTLVAISEQK